MRVWFIDDDPISNLISARMMVRVWPDAELSCYPCARAALSALARVDWPECIFLDLNMPGMDGWQFLDALQALPSPGTRPSVVILSSSVMMEDIERALRHPLVEGYLTKPLHMAELRVALGLQGNEFAS